MRASQVGLHFALAERGLLRHFRSAKPRLNSSRYERVKCSICCRCPDFIAHRNLKLLIQQLVDLTDTLLLHAFATDFI